MTKPKELSDIEKETVARIFRDVIFNNKTTESNWESAKPLWKNDLELFLKNLQEKGYALVKLENKK